MTFEYQAPYAPAAADVYLVEQTSDLTGASTGAVVTALATTDELAMASMADREGEAAVERRVPLIGDLSIEGALELAQTRLERQFIAELGAMSANAVPTPWGLFGPCFHSVVAYLDLDVDAAAASPNLPILLQRLGHLLTPAAEISGAPIRSRLSELTLIGTVRRKIAALPRGTAIPRFGKGKGVSWAGLAIMFGLSRNLMCAHSQVKAEVQKALKSGHLALGLPYVDKSVYTSAHKKACEKFIALLRARMVEPEPRPIEIDGLTRRRYAKELLFEEAGIVGDALRESVWRDLKVKAQFRKALELLGKMHVRDCRPKDVALSFAQLQELGRMAAADAYRQRNDSGSDDGAKRAAENEASFLSRAMKVNAWSFGDDVVERLLGPNGAAAIDKGCTGSIGGDKNYREAMTRFTSLATGLIDRQRDTLTFGERFMAGLVRKRLAFAEAARRFGTSTDNIRRWASDEQSPTFMQAHIVHRAERELGFAPDELLGMLGELRIGRNRTGRKAIDLSDGRTVELKRYLRYLPKGAVGWPEDRLREAVERADRKHYGSVTVNSVRQKAVSALSRSQDEFDPSMPIWTEWEDIVGFKTRLNDEKRVLNTKWEWRSTNTITNNFNHLKGFVRWLVTAREKGGMGLRPDQVGMYLTFNHHVIQKYVFHRTLRWSALSVDGKEMGPVLGGSEVGFTGFVKAMLDPEFGWLPQSRDVLSPAQVVDVTFELEEMLELDKKFIVRMPKRPVVCTVMSAELVELIDTDWTGAALTARRHVASLHGKCVRHYKMIRNPHDLIMPILIHDFPIAVVIRMVSEALKRACPLSVSKSQHAKDYRNAVAMLLLVTAVFRSETLRSMTYSSKGTGHLRRTVEGYDIKIESDLFKNAYCKWLFGPNFRKRDYERALGDWKNLNEIFDHYLKVCRPILLRGRDSDLLFPTGGSSKEWSESTFNTMITDWTRAWAVENERYGTGWPDVLPFGPHAVRDIVATHIIRNYDGEGRWELASAILGASVKVVREHYAFVDAKRELAKANGLYAEAFERGFSNQPL